jgi:hypothetical protein
VWLVVFYRAKQSINIYPVLSAVAVQVSFHSVFWFFVDILPTEVNLVLSQPVKLDAAK